MRSHFFTILITFVYTIPTLSEVGESSVITLIFPFGARNTAMGEVGTALADDDAALFYNPAGLGIPNPSWNGGSVSGFYERLLPYFSDLQDLWHGTISSYYQPPNKVIGGFGLFINYINMGENPVSDAFGNAISLSRSREYVIALGWGFNFCEYGDTSDNFGITAKFINSLLAPGMGENGEGTAQSVAFDFGYLRLFRSGLRFGFTLMNMGPDVFYIDRSNPDPIPFTINLALGLKKRLIFNENSNISLAAETRFDREIVKNHFSGKPDPFYKALYTDFANNTFRENIKDVNIHIGTEIGIINTGFLRYGYLIDYAGKRYEETFGIGLKFYNRFNLDYSYIHSPEDFMENTLGYEGSSGVRNKQCRISFTYSSVMRKLSEDDSKWWKSW